MYGRFLSCTLCFQVLLIGALAAQPLEIAVERAQVGYDQLTNEPFISFKMTDKSGRLFAELTRNNVGKAMAIRVDGRVIAQPVIREPILGGAGQLSGRFTIEEARDLADRLSKGSSRIEFEIVPK